MAPLLCWPIELTQLGSGAPGLELGASLELLQLASNETTVEKTSAVTRLRNMESPGTGEAMRYQ
jgi:hypothetical protein